jgi:hypothetical protein
MARLACDRQKSAACRVGYPATRAVDLATRHLRSQKSPCAQPPPSSPSTSPQTAWASSLIAPEQRKQKQDRGFHFVSAHTCLPRAVLVTMRADVMTWRLLMYEYGLVCGTPATVIEGPPKDRATQHHG